MPYEGEFAGYRPLRRIAESEQVKALLGRSRVLPKTRSRNQSMPAKAPEPPATLPEYVLAIDGSKAEVDVRNGYPGAKVGYVTVASVLLDLQLIDTLDEQRPIDPLEFRNTEQAEAIDASFPGTNVVSHGKTSARASLRHELFEFFRSRWIDDEDHTRLLDTYEVLLAKRPSSKPPACPYDVTHDCGQHFMPLPNTSVCQCPHQFPIYSTDALRIQDRFRDHGTNEEAFGLIMQVWERILLVHLLRCFERRELLGRMGRLAFFLDGPLAVFGPPAWLSAAISDELKRLNTVVKRLTGSDMIILGIEKSGEFVTHFEEMDQTETPGKRLFNPRDYLMPTDKYIKERITQSDSSKRYGQDTYFGRKFFYKTKNGARIVCVLPFLNDQQDTLSTDDVSIYPQFPTICALLDKLVSSRFQNALTPLVSAHANAAIPLHLGTKVLRELARALMQEV